MHELQTAREWSDDEEGGDPDDDEGLASSPSTWGTPRQNSLELTFSYIAIADAEVVGASRHLRDRRSRASTRGSRTLLVRTDTLETLLDSPDVDWDPPAFLAQEEASESGDHEQEEASAAERTEQHTQSDNMTIQPTPHSLGPDTEGGDEGIQREEAESVQSAQPPSPPPSSQHQNPAQIVLGEEKSSLFCFSIEIKPDYLIHKAQVCCRLQSMFLASHGTPAVSSGCQHGQTASHISPKLIT